MRFLLFVLLSFWLLAFLAAALWPFDFTGENLATSRTGRGLEFSPPSIAVSDGAPSKIAGQDSFTVFLRFFPDEPNAVYCILDYTSINTQSNMRILQIGDRLQFLLRTGDSGMERLNVPLRNPDSLNSIVCVIRRGRVTIRDSEEVLAFRDFRTAIGSTWDPEALLVFGCTARGALRWGGTLASFEVYRESDLDSLREPQDALLSYQFGQHSGRVIPDAGCEPRISLLVPARVKPPARRILASPLTYWDGEWEPRDIFNNVVAFIAFGVLFSLMFRRQMSRVVLILVATGFACLISLSVEVAQYLGPWRDSSVVDVVANSLGAFCGAWFSTTRLAARKLVQ